MTRLKRWFRPGVLRQWLPGATLGVAGVLVTVLVVWLLVTPRDDTDHSTTRPLPVPTTSASASDETGLAVPRDATVAVLGDSWSAGVGAALGEGWVDRVARRRGWTAGVIPGGATTGYLVKGAYGLGTYLDRLRVMPRDRDVDLVVIQGGLADVTEEAADSMAFNEAVRKVLRVAKRTYPRAKRLVIGPLNPYSPNPGDIEALDSRLAFEAEEAGVAYISPTTGQWFGTDSETMGIFLSGSASGDPNAKGYKRFANKVIDELKRLEGVAEAR